MDFKAAEVLLSTPVAELGEHTLIEFDDDRCILTRKNWHTRSTSRLEDLRFQGVGWDKGLKGVDPTRTVADVAGFGRLAEARRAFRLPPGRVSVKHSVAEGGLAGATAAAILGSTLAGVGAVLVQGQPGWGQLGFIVGCVLALSLLGVAIHFAFQVARSGRIGYDTGTEHIELSSLPLPVDVATAIRQVEQVKEEYGELLSDLPYRISNPALFDAAIPATETLTLALFEWDTTFNQLDDPARVRLAGEIVASFRQARDHAERIGMEHLPRDCRDPAEKALKAAELARDPNASPAERETALKVAVRILDQLALYYLPTASQAREALVGRRLRQLPGRGAP